VSRRFKTRLEPANLELQLLPFIHTRVLIVVKEVFHFLHVMPPVLSAGSALPSDCAASAARLARLEAIGPGVLGTVPPNEVGWLVLVVVASPVLLGKPF